MTALPLLVVKASLVLAVAFAATLLLRRRSAALRHWILAVGLFCAASMPALQWFAPEWTLPDSWSRSIAVSFPTPTFAGPAAGPAGEPGDMVTDGSSTTTASPPLSASISWTSWLVATWLSGTTGAFIILLAGLWRVRQVLKRTVPVTEPRWMEIASRISLRLRTRPVTLVEGSDPALLVTCGWWRPTIVLPPGCREWPDDKRWSVLSHELAHVRRRDWPIQLGAEVVRSVYWFNPLFWLAARRLRQESERACDDAVLNGGIDAASYASHLLDIARAASHSRALPLALGMAHSTSLEGRVRAMLGEPMDRRPVTTRAAIAAALCVLAIAMPIAAGTMEPAGQALEPLPLPAASIIAPLLAAPPSALETTSAKIRVRPAPAQRPTAQRMEAPGRVMPAPTVVPYQIPAVVQREVPATGTASFSGIVRGSAGASMAGVPVVMTDVATGANRTEKTTVDGRFAFFALPAARYTVTIAQPGWATVRHDVALEEGEQADRAFALKMGVVSEAVTVAPPGVRGDSAPALNAAPRAQASRVSPPVRTRRCDSNGLNCLSAPIKLVDVRPVYPTEALERGAQGVVILEAAIGQSGTVTDARVLRAIDPALNAAALEAVTQWEFAPTMLDDMPMAIIMSVTVNFSIQGN
jgi:TonB family protein